MDFLTKDNHLAHPLWIDQVDAEQTLLARVASKEISTIEALPLLNLINDGFCIVDLVGVEQTISNLLQELEVIWNQPPFDLAGAGPGHDRPLPLNEGLAIFQRGPGVRLLDIHSHVQAARDLYLHPTIHRLASLALGGEVVATQTLYFEYGSGQPLHRDPWYVNHTPRSHLFAAWIALEDILPESGPLNYVRGSHKFPYYRFPTDDIVFHDPRVNEADRIEARTHLHRQIENSPYPPEAALPKRGQAFLWHGSLVHGGSPVLNPALTRRSLVIHFGRRDTHLRRGAALIHNRINRMFFTTEQYQSNNGEVGWRSPVADLSPADFDAILTATSSDNQPKNVVPRCNLCGGTEFAPGPNQRLSSTGKAPCCIQCGALESQRRQQVFFDAVPAHFFQWRSALQVGKHCMLKQSLFTKVTLANTKQDDSNVLDGVTDREFNFINASHLFEYVCHDQQLFIDIVGLMAPRAMLLIGFAESEKREVSQHFSKPREAFGVVHRYGKDVQDYFASAGLGLQCLRLEITDPCTDSKEILHVFYNNDVDGLLLRDVIGIAKQPALRLLDN